MIRKGDAVGYKKSLNFRDAVLEDLLNLFANKGVIKLRNVRKADKIALSNTLDIESDKIVHTIIKGDVKKLKGFSSVDGKIIKPLYLFLDSEVLLYAKLRKLRFAKNSQANFGTTKSKTMPTHGTNKQDFVGKAEKIKKDKISLFVENMEKKHPELKRAVVNSYLELYF